MLQASTECFHPYPTPTTPTNPPPGRNECVQPSLLLSVYGRLSNGITILEKNSALRQTFGYSFAELGRPLADIDTTLGRDSIQVYISDSPSCLLAANR